MIKLEKKEVQTILENSSKIKKDSDKTKTDDIYINIDIDNISFLCKNDNHHSYYFKKELRNSLFSNKKLIITLSELLKIVKNIKTDFILIDIVDNKLTISNEKTSYNINLREYDDKYDIILKNRINSEFIDIVEVDSDVLKTLNLFTSKDRDSALDYVCYKHNQKFYATDGGKLLSYTNKTILNKLESDILIHNSIIDNLSKGIYVLSKSNNHIKLFNKTTGDIYYQDIEDLKYTDCDQYIPERQGFNIVELSKNELNNSLDEIKALLHNITSRVDFSFDKNKIFLSTKNEYENSATTTINNGMNIDVHYNKISFNFNFLKILVKVSENIILNIPPSSTCAMRFDFDDKNFVGLLMPAG